LPPIQPDRAVGLLLADPEQSRQLRRHVRANSSLEFLAFELAELRDALANVKRIAFRLRHNSEQVGSPPISGVRKSTSRVTDTRSG